MAKADDAIKELQRRLGHLERLDGAALRTADGVFVLAQPRPRDPFVLLDACRAGAPSLAALRAGLHLDDEPRRLAPALLARARHDLRALAALPWSAIVRDAPRHFRRYGALDERWLLAREARVDFLTRVLHPDGDADAPAHGDAAASDPDELTGAHALVAGLHGAHASDVLRTWLARSAALGARRRREAQRRIDGLAARLDVDRAPPREPAALAAMLDAAARELTNLARLPGRAAARRFAPLLRRVLAWPAAPSHAPLADAPAPPDPSPPGTAPTISTPVLKDTSPAISVPAPTDTSPTISAPVPTDTSPTISTPVPADTPPAIRAPAPAGLVSAPRRPVPRDSLRALAARVRARGGELVRALGSTRRPDQLAALRRVLAAYALAFPPRPGDPAPAPLGPDELELAEQRLREAVADGLPALSLTAALWLLRLPVEPQQRRALAPWVAGGLAPALVDQVRAIDRLDRLTALQGDAELAAAYAGWLVRLVPHYRRQGIDLELDPEQFTRLHATHRGGLALLAHCLIVHHVPDERGADAHLARLRATLGLFAARPRRAEALLADLSQGPAGLGRRLLPEFAAWLGEPALLDRFCHLCELAGEPVAASHALRRDFDRHARLARQRDYLAALPAPGPEQRARLAACELELAAGDLTDRTWTLRRLAERCDAVQARAFARRLDVLLREVLAGAIGTAPPALTPAWRDALRFYLDGAERNRGLLGQLLRFAAAHPGRPIAPTLPRNQAWLARAAAHMRTAPWLAARRRVVDVDSQRHILSVEDDPLEVLRMGIPFDTCLALPSGFNADSTVLNAVDINKRVLYVRDARGSVVARKLIAVAADFTLLGYRLYQARDGEARGAVARAVAVMCRELADECGLPLADHGAPETIHPGFWYDDGVVAWTADAGQRDALAELAPQFAALGRPIPTVLSDWSLRQLQAWRVHAAGDLDAALGLHPHLHVGEAAGALADLIAARLDPRDLAARARRDPALARVHLRQRARDGVLAVLRALPRVAHAPDLVSAVTDALDHAPPAGELARAWISAAQHTRRSDLRFDDHGLEHRTFHIGPHLADLPVAEILACCADLGPLWDWVVAEGPGCAGCRHWGESSLRAALVSAYARDPDPPAVIAALRGRHGPLARLAALHLAAIFSLSHRPCPLRPGTGASWLTRLDQRPLPAPAALRALRELQRTCPALAAAPELFAALVRQAGPAGPHVDLPRPHESPVELLAELLLHLPDPAALLAPWLDPGVAPADWSPGPWQRHLHRRALTPWRRRLARLAADDSAARRWLGHLGDVEALTRLDARGDLAQARDVRWQLGLTAPAQDVPRDMSSSTPRPVPRDMSSKTLAPVPPDRPPDPPSLLAAAATPRADLRGRDAQAIDPLLLRQAARALELHAGADLPRALDLCHAAGLEPVVWHDILARLWPAGPPPPALHSTLADLLRTGALPGLPVARLARLAAVRALHDPALAHIDVELRAHRSQLHPLCSQLAALPSDDPPARDDLIAAAIVQAGEDAAAIDTPLGAHDRERFAACLAAWTSRAAPATWLAVYRQLELSQASRMLDALLALPPTRDPELARLRDEADLHWANPHGEDETAAAQWLRAALDARLGAACAPDSPHSATTAALRGE